MSGNVIIPRHYIPKLELLETQLAIKTAKDTFEAQLAEAMTSPGFPPPSLSARKPALTTT